MEAVEYPKSLVLNKETASDSGIDEEEEYYDPMAMEPGLGAADDSGGNKLSSRITEPDPRGLLSSVLVPNTSLMESMRLWVFSTNKHTDTRPERELVEGDTDGTNESKKDDTDSIDKSKTDEN